jgi:hypothetical protein
MDIKLLLGDKYKEGMTLEELTAALAEAEMPEPQEKPDASSEIAKYKKLISEANAEAADFKKQLNAKMTEAEAAEAERKEQDKKTQKELSDLRKANQLTELTTKYVTLGYDEKLAKATAEAFVDGDMDTVFANSQKHLDAVKAAAKTAALDDTPKPKGGQATPKDVTQEQFTAMEYTQRVKLATDNPKLYSQLEAAESGDTTQEAAVT